MNAVSDKAIIIGSGIGGLAISIRLAVKGYQVEVFEKNSYPGGKLSFFEQEGYQFDAGPSLFTQPANIEELFELAGEDIHEYFQYDKVDIACRYFFEDGKIINAYSDPPAFANELKQKSGEDEQAVVNYLRQSAKLYDNTGSVFLNHSLHKRRTWLHKRIFRALLSLRYPHLFRTLDQLNSKKFRTREAVQIFNRFATYNGSSPYKAPGMLSLISHVEQQEGVFYPRGGMISISNALYRLALKKGVKFYFNSAVQRIIHYEGKVRGVVVNNKNVNAGLVVSNMDIYFTYRYLLNNPHRSQKIVKQERSSSALIFYWGMSRSFPALHLHNIFFSSNYKEEFDHLFVKKRLFADPTVYVNITSKMEQGMAPAEKENWFVLVNAPANPGLDWKKIREECRNNVITKLSRILGEEIGPFIETENYLDPLMIEESTASYMGSLYGTSSNSKMAAFLRHPNFTSTIKGLYFAGGSVHPGGGIPLCLKSAKIIDSLIKPARHS